MMELVKTSVLILTISVEVAFARQCSIQEFQTDNGHHYVEIFYNSSMLHDFLVKDLFASRLLMKNIGKAHNDSFGVFLFENAKDDLANYLTEIVQRKIKMSLLIISETSHTEMLDLIRMHLSAMGDTALFYLALPANGSSDMIWQQIISLKTGTTINYLEFPEDSCKIIEAYDLHGLEITATSLTWAPYLKIDGCNEVGLHCLRNEGYMIDIMDHLGAQYNFTYLSQKNVDSDWGMMPVNGTWIGVWGDIIKNDHDMTLGPWYNTFERNYFFDFVPLIQTRDILAMKPQHSKIDFGLFTRVFVGDTLFYISFIAGTTCCLAFWIGKYTVGRICLTRGSSRPNIGLLLRML